MIFLFILSLIESVDCGNLFYKRLMKRASSFMINELLSWVFVLFS
jgi:hypothetical protein